MATLFAALSTLDSKVIRLCQERHRHQNWLRFLPLIDDTISHWQTTLSDYGQLRHAQTSQGAALAEAASTPSALWLNMVERFFRGLTVQRSRHAGLSRCSGTVTAIDNYVDQHNENPNPFIRTAKASDILEKMKRARKSRLTAQSV